MAENGRWLTVWKSYDLNRDSVLIFDSRHPGKPVGYRTNVKSIAFTGTGQLLIKRSGQAELLDSEGQTAACYKGVKQLHVLNNKKQFVLHYDEDGDSRIELRDVNGDLINALDHVSRFYVTGDDPVCAVVKNEKNGFEVFRLKGKIKEKVYGCAHEILSLDIDPGRKGMMIHEQNPDNGSREVLYLDLKTKTVFPLKEVLPVSFQNGFSEVVREGNAYFLRLWVNEKKEDTSPVDIWYGNDNRLEEKFHLPVRELYYLWEPRAKKVQRIGNNQFTKNANIGNDRYFLSFDPYLLQDYTREVAPLKLERYDRIKEAYSVIDTISSRLYTSPEGRYALSFKNNTWYVCHIPSGTFRTVGSNRLTAPYFTRDGKTVLFEGEGGLWRYDLQEEELVQLTDFEGYRVTVLNGTSRITLRGFSFFEKTIDIQKPLVLRLDDPRENRSAYLLWKNSRLDTIIPSTTKRIQSLNYNRSFTCFSWLEENYNLPPRLVYREIGEAETILYQSNKQDKAILSLRQEIISYTNGDGFPLKGILYFPVGYDPSQKYPMVVHIYEKQHQLANRYPYPSYDEGLGFNIRLFLEQGYFVYLPDILIQGKNGPGIDALDCVNNALDALTGNPLIDKERIGLIGHSFGGYETDFIATRSTRFAAYVAGSGHSDIIWAANAFNYNFHFPDYVRIEANMYKLGVPFFADKDLYLKNNPLYRAEKVNAPVLLWTGLADQNVTSDHSMAFYNALRRNKKEVIVLFYKGEGHSLQNMQNQFDLTSRILDWFNYFLEGDTDIRWINKGIRTKDAP